MTQPAIVIGLGGTGRWVLTYLKRSLLEAYDGVVPHNVRLLAYDTVTEDQSASRDETISHGGVRLQPNEEFFSLGGDLYDFHRSVKEKRYPSISRWFDADYYLRNLPRAFWSLSSGSGQIRAIGRLALLQDLARGSGSTVRNSLQHALSSCGVQSQSSIPLRVFVIASLAGGTGSAMFIDIALLVREACSKNSIPNLVSAFLALPEALDSDRDNASVIRCAAAWRELNRFMATTKGAPTVLTTDYSDALLRETSIPHQRVFDVCYLVDGATDDGFVFETPQNAVFPSIAEAINVMIDDYSGSFYSSWVTANWARVYSALPGEPMYCAFGTHTYKASARYFRDRNAYRLALATLDTLLNPDRDHTYDPQRLVRLRPTQLQEPHVAGRDRALDVLARPQFYEDSSEHPTLFLQFLARILKEGGKSNRSLVTSAATAGTHRTPISEDWLASFTRFEDRVGMVEMQKEVDAVVKARLFEVIRTSKDMQEEPSLGQRRLHREVDAWMAEYFGKRDVVGEPGAKGRIGQVLEKCGAVQLEVFSRLLRLWLQATLMGSAEESPLSARGGKIGYACDLLGGLIGHLETLREFMYVATEQRNEMGIAVKAVQGRVYAEREMMHRASQKVIFWNHPQAHKTQTRFLEAVQGQVDVYTIDLLNQAIIQTLRAMQSYCTTLLIELESWINTLIGSPGGTNVYKELQRACQQIELFHKTDQQTRVQTVLQPDSPDYQEDDIAHFLGDIRWNVHEEHRGKPIVSLELASSDGWDALLEHPTSAGQFPVFPETRNASFRLWNHARLRLANKQLDSGVLESLLQEYPNPASLIKELSYKARPLFRGNPSRDLPRSTTAVCWMHLPESQQQGLERNYVEEIRSGLRLQHGVPISRLDQYRLVDVRDFSDSSKVVMLNTLDLIEVNGFRAWSESVRAYSNASRLPMHMQHVFPAEVNAAQYEARLVTTRHVDYRLFHPRVVALLNDIAVVRQFVIAWASGWIALKHTDGLTKVEFSNPIGGKQTTVLTQTSDRLPDPFVVIIEFERVSASIFKSHPELEQLLSPKTDEQTAELIFRLQRERESTKDSGSLLGWINKYSELTSSRAGMADQVAFSEIVTRPEAYRDLGQLIELLLEEFLGSRTNLTPLDFDTMRFFQSANWKVTDRRSGHLLCSPPAGLPERYNKPICVRTFFGSAIVDGKAIQRLHEVATLEFKGVLRDRIVMAISDQPPAAAALGHIYGYRAGDEGLAIIVLPSSVMRRAISDKTAVIELNRQLRFALGDVNLYERSMPITDFLTFFGRGPIIEKFLNVIDRGEHVGIFGLRKMGKTSLMWQLKERLTRNGVALIDLQMVGQEASPLYPLIIRDLVQDLAVKYPGVRLPTLELLDNPELLGMQTEERASPADLISAFEHDMTSLHNAFGKQQPDIRFVLFLDEVERMLPAESYEGFRDWEQFWGVLRGIAQRRGFLSLVVASVDARLNRKDRINGLDNPAYRMLSHTMFLPPFTSQENFDMIANIGSQMGVQWEQSAMEAVHHASGGHPFISRELCSRVVSIDRDSKPITKGMVDQVMQDWLNDPDSYAAELWDARLSKQEQQILVVLAESQPIHGQDLLGIVSNGQDKEFRKALASLIERHIVSKKPDHTGLAIPIDVLRLWIREYVLGSVS